MTHKMGMRFYISGRVQGVWFRASTKAQADLLGITGFARNCEDGRVEVVAYGETEKLQQLHAWLKHGPSLAKVTAVTHEACAYDVVEDFQTR